MEPSQALPGTPPSPQQMQALLQRLTVTPQMKRLEFVEKELLRTHETLRVAIEFDDKEMRTELLDRINRCSDAFDELLALL